jgi:FAD:protein FMN transferase
MYYYNEVIILSRRIWASILMIVLILNLTACSLSTTTKSTRYEATFLELFDTVTTIVGYAQTKEEFSKNAQMIYDDLKQYHELFDIYNNYDGINNIKTINDNAGKQPVKVDQKIIDLLNFSKEMYELTDGMVNIAFGAVLAVWHDYREAGTDDPESATLPPMDILKEKSQHTDINKMIINEKDLTVYLEDPDMRLDVGAIAKGYATEKVCDDMIEKGLNNVSVSVGGNVRTIGTKEDGKEWNVGIQNPDLESDNKYLYILKLKDLSLVTSGIYERYYTVDGKQYHHIIDSVTLLPSTFFTSVSIVTQDSGLADALSTSVFNMPYEQGVKLIESLPDTEALWVFMNGDMKYSSGFKKYIKE